MFKGCEFSFFVYNIIIYNDFLFLFSIYLVVYQMYFQEKEFQFMKRNFEKYKIFFIIDFILIINVIGFCVRKIEVVFQDLGL